MIELGFCSYACDPQFRGNANKITVGNFSSIADGCVFDCGFNHNYKNVTTFPLHKLDARLPSNIRETLDITIQNDCWIGEGVMIMSGITIENGAVIGANSVVRRDILPYEIYTGSKTPEKFRFKSEIIEKLLEISWWDWEESRILANAHLLVDKDINNFLNNHI